VFVDAHANVELLDQRFDDIELRDVFGGDAIEAELFGELKNAPPLGGVASADDSVIDGADFVLGELGLNLGDDFLGRIVIPLHIPFLRAQHLVGKELDETSAGLVGFFDGFEDGETIEGVGLRADGESAGAAFRGDFILRRERQAGHADERGEQEGLDGGGHGKSAHELGR
jgi:hypothetical protein